MNRKYIKTTITDFLNESYDFILDKGSEEYDHISHGYGIKDYSKIDSDLLKSCEESIELFKDKVDLFQDIKVVFVNKIGRKLLGKFRCGTSTSAPVIILSDKNLIKTAEEYDLPLWVTVETTILHELGHAICELDRDVFDGEYLEYEDEEEWVENFAHDLHTYGDVSHELEAFIQVYKESLN